MRASFSQLSGLSYTSGTNARVVRLRIDAVTGTDAVRKRHFFRLFVRDISVVSVTPPHLAMIERVQCREALDDFWQTHLSAARMVAAISFSHPFRVLGVAF